MPTGQGRNFVESISARPTGLHAMLDTNGLSPYAHLTGRFARRVHQRVRNCFCLSVNIAASEIRDGHSCGPLTTQGLQSYLSQKDLLSRYVYDWAVVLDSNQGFSAAVSY